MQDASSYYYIVSYALYLSSLVLLMMFCFKTHNNRLWAVAIVLFLFGAFLETNMLLPIFLSILYSGVMVIVFGSRGNIVYSVASVLIFWGAILSSEFSNIFIFVIFVVTVFSFLSRFFVEKRDPGIIKI
jgi:hypothetical protein